LQNHLGDDSFPFKGPLYSKYRYQSQDASPVSPTAIAITSLLSTGPLFHHPVPLAVAEAPFITLAWHASAHTVPVFSTAGSGG